MTAPPPGRTVDGMIEEVRNALAAMDEIAEPWQPHRLTSINDYDVKLAKFDGEFVWHSHPDTDEFFLVLAGSVTIRMRDRDVELGPHDVFVVPRGVEHCPAASSEASVLMFEPNSTVNTGDAGGERTQAVRELS